MARAYSIRVVQDPAGRVVAAFTVKHEWETWFTSKDQAVTAGFTTTTVRDGGR